ncbi:PHP domain-containing protein [Methanoculleus sp.]|uniref:PHP domain-containing protein n=1 Tax=Methanoculleus sp. TaxID=90427 RepID=UPI00262E0718|nr:PHP domain-containing protein [Methanoculleus sp.]MDI6867746.1 PHP domain-containing protein [Methanoculleus sp.]
MIDLHIHSKYSFDSLLSPKTILKVAKKKGLTGIAVTDHNTIRGGLEVRNINKDSDFTVIVGSEVQTEIGDIIGLCLNEEIKSRISIEVLEEIKDQEGFVVLPHPFRGHKLNQYIIEHSDAIEVFNGRSTPEENNNALELAKKYNKPFTAGSDAHFASEIGNGRIGVNLSASENVENEPLIDALGINGQQSPRYLVDASQVIKSLKHMEYLQSIQHTACLAYRILMSRH